MFDDVNDAMIFCGRGPTDLVFSTAVKRSPQTTICFTITEEDDLFRRHLRNAHWVINVNEFVEALAIDECCEEPGILGSVNVGKHSHLDVISQSLSKEILI